MKTANKNIVNIYLEANPNPNSLKFVANFMLVQEGESYDFPDKEISREVLQDAFKSLVHQIIVISNLFVLGNEAV